MDFYQQQDDAAASSRQLVLLFVLAVALVLLAINGLGALAWSLATGGAELPRYFLITNSFVVLLYVFGGAWLEWSRLLEGGAAVAHRLGAKSPNPYDPRHKRLTNICEELAIAAGIPVPEVFVLDHDSINALAAGHDPAHSAVVITHGALRTLTRDELQGVVAHEIAHIVNGDAALNTHLAGGLYGLNSLYLLGRQVIGLPARMSRDEEPPALIFFPIALLVGGLIAAVGWIGAVCGRLVQAGVSRQREFLADALALRFTRSRDGLGGALRKIAGQDSAEIDLDYSDIVAHLWMSSDRSNPGWFDTHPPLITRIRRLYGRPLPPIRPQVIDVNDGGFVSRKPALAPLQFGNAPALGVAAAVLMPAADQPAARRGNAGSDAGEPADLATAVIASEATPAPSVDQATRQPVRQSKSAPADVPDGEPAGAARAKAPVNEPAQVLLGAVRELGPSVSKAALILNAIVAGPVTLAEQETNSDDALYGSLLWLEQPEAQWLRVPLIELLSARVRHWPLECRRTLVRYCHDAVLADGRIEKTEWIYFTLVRHRLVPLERPAAQSMSGIDKRKALAEVFSMAGQLSQQSARRIRDAVVSAAEEIGVPQPAATPEQFEFRSLTRALDVLSTLAPLRKPQLLKILEGLSRSNSDAAYSAFLVAVAAAIDCPPLRSVSSGPAASDQNGAGQPSAPQMAS